jgi:protein-L-isoaspartate(D-aspartate) O-methyltransferase
MLELLDLAPGMSVLEIGTGSGYNAALIRELVGSYGTVVSVDNDPTLVSEAQDRLAAVGYGDVQVVASDGYFGMAEGAPFDRVVATVGCVDVAPAWLDQLAPGGFCLVPLQHDGWHPLTRVDQQAGDIFGVVVGRAGFVAIQGRQAGRAPWPRAGRLGPRPDVEWAALPAALAQDLLPEPGREATGSLAMWDLSYLLALEDRRTAFLLSLAESDSSAVVDAGGGRIGWAGTGGGALRDRILEVADRWVALSRPKVGDYRSTFRLLSDPHETADLPASAASWELDRVDFCQTVLLPLTAESPG